MGCSTGPQGTLPRTGQAVSNSQVSCLGRGVGGGRGGGFALFLLNRKRSQAQSLATWFPTPSSFALLHFTPIPLMQEEYQEYEPEA